MSLEALGKFLMGAAVVLLVVGGLLFLLGRGLGLVKLPGDLVYRRDHVNIYFPIVTSIVVSILLTVVVNIVLYFTRGR